MVSAEYAAADKSLPVPAQVAAQRAAGFTVNQRAAVKLERDAVAGDFGKYSLFVQGDGVAYRINLFGGGVGGVLGSLTDHGVPADHAHVYAEGVRRGGAIVAAKIPDDKRVVVDSILARHKFVDPVARGGRDGGGGGGPLRQATPWGIKGEPPAPVAAGSAERGREAHRGAIRSDLRNESVKTAVIGVLEWIQQWKVV